MVRHSWAYYTWRSQHATEPAVGSESRFVRVPTHLHSTPPFPSEYCHDVWYGNTRMMWLLDGEKNWRYVYLFRQNPRTWQTDGQTDAAWRHRPRLHSITRQKTVGPFGPNSRNPRPAVPRAVFGFSLARGRHCSTLAEFALSKHTLVAKRVDEFCWHFGSAHFRTKNDK